MDSLTQFTLGAAVGAAVLGPKLGPRKAALTGGLLGTLPDLDILFPFDDPIDSFTLHRGASHSFFVQALVTPLFGEALTRLFKSLRDHRIRNYLAVYLIFATHAALDALTIYGTRIFWPVFPDAVGTGSIFIIDPLYTLPLLLVVIWAFCLRAWSPGFRKSLATALVFTTAYLAWGLVAQQVIAARTERLLADAEIAPERLLAIPTPFNSLFWKVIAMDGDRYINLYVPFFGPREKVTAFAHPRGADHTACLGKSEALAKLTRFSDGFLVVALEDGEFLASDLRMGMTPNYVFRFAIAEQTTDGIRPMAPERRETTRRAEGDIDWLLANLIGDPVLRPIEANALVDLLGRVQVARAQAPPVACS